MGFHEECEHFLRMHCRSRTGERLRRLSEGLGHSEKAFLETVWWPMFHHFDHLHPEYEIHDYKDGFRYIDFAYIQPYFRVAMEIDGVGPHWRNITKWQFSDHCQRQNHLVIDGWHVLRFSYDDIRERPRLCQQTIQQLMGRWLTDAGAVRTLSAEELEIVRIALRSSSITAACVREHLHIGPALAHKLLRALAQKHWLQPTRGTVRIRAYTLHPSRANVKL